MRAIYCCSSVWSFMPSLVQEKALYEKIGLQRGMLLAQYFLNVLVNSKTAHFVSKRCSAFQAGGFRNGSDNFLRRLSFLFGKAAKAPRWGHDGSFKTSKVGLKRVCKCPALGQQQNCIFQKMSCKCHIYRKSVIIWSKRVKHPSQVPSTR